MRWIKMWFTLLKQVVRVSPVIFAAIALIHILLAVLPVLEIYLISQVINAVTEALEQQLEVQRALFLVGIQLALILIRMVLNTVKKILEQKLDIKVVYTFNLSIIEKLNAMSYLFFEQPHNYDNLQRALRNLEVFGVNVVFHMLSIAQNSIKLAGLMYLLYNFHSSLPILLLLLIIPLLIIQRIEGKSQYSLFMNQTASSRKASYIGSLLQSKEAAKEMRLFNSKDFFIARWKRIYFKNANERFRVDMKNATNRLYTESFVSIFCFGILSIFIWVGAQSKKVKIGDYVALFQAIQETQFSIKDISQSLGQIYRDSLFIQELVSFMDEPATEYVGTQAFPDTLRQGIKVQDLCFQYPTQPHQVLKKISFTIRAGETIAIVGENGSGKSTLVKCLLGLYPPTSGSIEYDGIPLSSFNRESFRERVTAVFQDYMKYEITVDENIRLHDENGDQWIHDRLRKAKAVAGIDSFVEQLPQKGETQLGTRFSGGVELSQGQWQKVAITRAMYRDFEVIFLDEPTAAVDPITESKIFEDLMQLTKGKTAVFISHRLGSCRHADRIFVMENGELTEQGSHEELTHSAGKYADMFERQAQWYR